jgi:rod shape-determining protein MreD
MHRRWLITLATMLLLWSLVAQINHHLAPYGVSLFAGGLLVTFGALRLGLRNGLFASMLTGLVIDALEPVPFGTHLLLFAGLHIVIYHLRTRFPREETVFGVVIALLANLALFLALSFATLGRQPAAGSAWLRLFADLGCSQLFIAVAAPWYFALQQRALELGHVDLAEEDRHAF